MKMSVLVVEDDQRVADFLERGLRAEGYQVEVARDGLAGLDRARHASRTMAENPPNQHIMLLDLMLPGMNGLEVCQTLRLEGIALPILMLTAISGLEDRVAGLRLGADDYLGKPFAFEELLARIEALGRRSRNAVSVATTQLVVGDLVLDRNTMRVSRNGVPIMLTAKELALLELLMSAPGRMFSRERILSNVWGVSEDPLTNVVDVFIRRVRNKIDLGDGSSLIQTVRGLGYRLDPIPAPPPSK
jgi:DNA-binding response OmpR family regulator